MVIGTRWIARVEELAGDGVGAVRSGSKVGSLGLVENTEERPQPEGEIVLQFFNAAGQIPDPEELPHVDGAALKDVTPVMCAKHADATSIPPRESTRYWIPTSSR